METDNKYDIITPEDIDSGKATDAYFERTEAILEAEGENPHVVAEIQQNTENWSVFSGLKDLAHLLEGKPLDLYARREGSFFRRGPVVRIEGPYQTFCRFETSILGFICKPSAVATSAMRSRAAAEDVSVISFGTRREHPATAGAIERSALVGGMDGISHVAAGEKIGVEASGTMPHALVISLRDPVRAWTAYDRVLDDGVPRIMLCDTYLDEKRETIMAADALGNALDGVRLDTPSSRKGNFREIAEEVRWELDRQGYDHVDIFLSGGIGARHVLELKDVADGFGIGTYVASARPINFSMNIVEVEGEPAAKRGEKSFAKQVYRKKGRDVVERVDKDREESGELVPVLKEGQLQVEFDWGQAQKRTLSNLDSFSLSELGVAQSEDH